MYNVYPATLDDIDTLLLIAMDFWKESPTYSLRPINIEKVKKHLIGLISNYHGVVFKCVDATGYIVGGFAGAVCEEWQADSLMGFDYCLFVRKENRGSRAAKLLITAFQYWCKSVGCNYIQCGTATGIQPERTIRFYEKMGFKYSGAFLEMDIMTEQ